MDGRFQFYDSMFSRYITSLFDPSVHEEELELLAVDPKLARLLDIVWASLFIFLNQITANDFYTARWFETDGIP